MQQLRTLWHGCYKPFQTHKNAYCSLSSSRNGLLQNRLLVIVQILSSQKPFILEHTYLIKKSYFLPVLSNSRAATIRHACSCFAHVKDTKLVLCSVSHAVSSFLVWLCCCSNCVHFSQRLTVTGNVVLVDNC